MNKNSVYTDHNINIIKRMKAEGSTNREIAMAIGVTESSFSSRVSQLGLASKKGCRIPPAIVPTAIAQVYFDAASARNLTLGRLIRRLIVCIAEANLISAILDDGK